MADILVIRQIGIILPSLKPSIIHVDGLSKEARRLGAVAGAPFLA